MPDPTPPFKQSVQIVCSNEFERHVNSCLNPIEHRGLLLLIKDNSRCGATVGNLPGLRGLDYAGCIVYYSVAPHRRTVYLLWIEKVDGHLPTSASDRKLLRQGLSFITKGIVMLALRDAIKRLWNLTGR